MKRNNKYLLAFAVVVIVPTVLIWAVAWPILRPWQLPAISAGTVEQPGQQAGMKRSLSGDEIAALNHWLHANPTGWGISGETPPKAEETPPVGIYRLASADGKAVILSAWQFRHGEDVVGIQTRVNGPYRMHSFPHTSLDLPGMR